MVKKEPFIRNYGDVSEKSSPNFNLLDSWGGKIKLTSSEVSKFRGF